MSVELMAEAAALLLPGLVPIGARNVRAHRWIIVEEAGCELTLAARRDGEGREVLVRLLEGDASGARTLSAEGTIVFGARHEAPPAAGAPPAPLRAPRPHRVAPEAYYRREVMYHGPAFQSVALVERCGDDGVDALLRIPPPSRLFPSGSASRLLLDPVLLDAAGQAVGFWTADRLERGFATFPVGFESLTLHRPPSAVEQPVRCHARSRLLDGDRIRSDLDFVDASGRVALRLVGWEDARFDFPRSFVRFVLAPRDVVLGAPWPAAAVPVPDGASLRCTRLDPLPDGVFAGGLWPSAVARIVLTPRERDVWRALTGGDRRRRDWLMGRLAAKDAVRTFLAEHRRVALCPGDIEIVADEHGRPMVDAALGDRFGCRLHLSITHAGGTAAAAVAEGEGEGEGEGIVGIGIDIEPLGRRHDGLDRAAFLDEERAFLDALAADRRAEWSLRLWCAKEAVAKALGRGLAGIPSSLPVREVDEARGLVVLSVERGGELARLVPALAGRRIRALTGRDGDLMFASAVVRLDGRA
jgi:phosphopantetheinyl transferase